MAPGPWGVVQGMRDQHSDGYAWTWEPLVGVLLGIAVALLFSVQTGRGMALMVAGHGFQWPPSTALITSVGGILAGDIHAGLTTTGAGSIAFAWVLTVVVAAAVLTAGAFIIVRQSRGSRFKGMATSSQASQLLGHDRLRRNRAIVRPDLYTKKKVLPW